MKHRYRLIFAGQNSKEIRLCRIDKNIVDELRNTEESNILSSVKELNSDELHTFGISRKYGYIKVFEIKSDFDDLENAEYLLYPEELKINYRVHEPEASTIIAGYSHIQDGIIGHIDLILDEEFNPNKMILIENSSEEFGGKSAIDGIKYESGDETLVSKICTDDYLQTKSQIESVWISEFDSSGKKVPIYENSEWWLK